MEEKKKGFTYNGKTVEEIFEAQGLNRDDLVIEPVKHLTDEELDTFEYNGKTLRQIIKESGQKIKID